MRREDLAELAKANGIDLAAVELTDAELEAVVGGKDVLGGGSGRSSSSGSLSKLLSGNSRSSRF